ncbi:nitroreductase family deazaflavin-dependent oxidoreductase [Mycobacterium intracellulare]|uniref:Nitroreductase family deazaflavin-dependent oxidoreductase n=1 Tax=Mycobacterium intracellulare TaxID=1767 RepID=A0AAE4R914_MYCIT|nr:nitroreductase family deazaflavin-dependent oxidoreductase [Mycobacterium intracellulare]MCA2256554.1 nitroreductase family deazaflavin-dependent oxidoreductase [Mycobacterium intracellulare]MCA2305263.1 nitroreductase family deazaflavin-dependent oxidoreductase [Mycobacterium intracellulare]MCA2320038.1 nitroreductase family deazaflavin-dependent oxidoreductase [Mycobacterium intracellulare]MCA2340626.1 nitroreductase family deazaflavin-dependent oxidoreductase [Mycobacterium intracellulare
MPAPRWVARANKIGLNRFTKYIAPWAPGWAIVVHRGRKSGRTFRTPLWAFRRHNGFVIALTYGPETDWVRNVLAAGGCELQTRRRRYQLGAPVVFRDEDATDMPAFIRFMLRRVIKAPEFLRLDIVSQLATAR